MRSQRDEDAVSRSLPGRRACVAVALGFVLFWIVAACFGYLRYGLFVFPGLGTDFTPHWISATALDAGDLDVLYAAGGREQYADVLDRHVLAGRDASVHTTPLAYHPLVSWLFKPFTLPSPPVGFVLWAAVNLIAAVWLAHRARSLVPIGDRLWVGAAVLSSFPVAFSIYLGQVQVLLAVALAECYLALRAGKDLRAGIWLSVLLIKPQYALLLGVLLLAKRRWAAVAGAAAGVAAALVGSVLVTSVSTVVRWPDALSSYNGFRDDAPQFMVNWRALVLHVMRAVPQITDGMGIAVTLVLSAATLACVAMVWRGRWNPSDPTFPAKVCLLFLATVLVNFHSHGYGAAVLVVPLVALLAQGTASTPTKIAIGAGYVLPNAALVLQVVYDSEGVAFASLLLGLCVVVTFGALLQTLWTASQPAAGRSRTPQTAEDLARQ